MAKPGSYTGRMRGVSGRADLVPQVTAWFLLRLLTPGGTRWLAPFPGQLPRPFTYRRRHADVRIYATVDGGGRAVDGGGLCRGGCSRRSEERGDASGCAPPTAGGEPGASGAGGSRRSGRNA